MRKCAFFFLVVSPFKGPNEITLLQKKNVTHCLYGHTNTTILNVGGVCVRVLMYSEPLGNKQSRTLKTQAGKAPNTLSF